jgi:formylglycine-generating enzyme required for sulfatase activity
VLKSTDSAHIKGIPVYPENVSAIPSAIKTVSSAQQDTSYRFPILTDKEIAENNKRKKKMFDAFTKLTLFAFPNIQACTFKYHGTLVSLQAYHLECAVVNNNMYRTFLSDLLIQGRKSDFIIAKVDQKQWTKVQGIDYGEYMRENYFSNSIYNDYPVVNISRQGAEMFCKWIEDGIREKVAERYKGMKAIVRIPTDAEWYYAATAGGKDTIYPWGTASINAPYTPHGKDKGTNKKGCFLADFCLKKYTGNLDSMRECTDRPYKNAYTTTGFILGENIFTAPIYSYNPNPLGFYAMAGNVASMVNVKATDGTLTPGTRGGSWGSDAEHLKINSPDEYAGQTGPSPFIGLRPVVILTDK